MIDSFLCFLLAFFVVVAEVAFFVNHYLFETMIKHKKFQRSINKIKNYNKEKKSYFSLVFPLSVFYSFSTILTNIDQNYESITKKKKNKKLKSPFSRY